MAKRAPGGETLGVAILLGSQVVAFDTNPFKAKNASITVLLPP